jgi:hypothetical protein
VGTHALSRFRCIAAVGMVVVAFLACGLSSTTVSVVATPTATATATPAATPTPPPALGVCNPADFPTKTPGGPGSFQYPPLTYSYDLTPGMGNHPSRMCSSGTPASILAFMKQSVTTAGWKTINTTASSVTAENPTNPPSGYCYTVDIQVGGAASYPGEWLINFHPPATPCS